MPVLHPETVFPDLGEGKYTGYQTTFEFQISNKLFFSLVSPMQYVGHTYIKKIICCLSEIQI